MALGYIFHEVDDTAKNKPELPCHVPFSECDRIFGNNSFFRRRVCCDKDRIAPFKTIDGLLLKCVELERILEIYIA